MLMEILHMKDLRDTECHLTANAVVPSAQRLLDFNRNVHQGVSTVPSYQI